MPWKHRRAVCGLSNYEELAATVPLKKCERAKRNNKEESMEGRSTGFSRYPLGILVAILCLFLVLSDSGPSEGAAENRGGGTGSLAELELETLMNLEVTSVSKKAERLSQASAAVFVITQEDIRRSGATSIPELLRMVPGVQVARIDANKWAISARGFNGRFANKLLVLIDGRSVYTPLFSGVYWDVQDLMLEDIERIEVIRGPGATLWGANAVNGVINIITKSAWDSRGGIVTGGVGTEERAFGSMRYGGRIGQDTAFRAYAKYFSRDDTVDAEGRGVGDDWDVLRAGFRLDSDLSLTDMITLQGDVYTGKAGVSYNLGTFTPPFFRVVKDKTDISGGNIVVRWKRVFSETSDLVLQTYYDRTERSDVIGGEVRDTIDLDFQHRFGLGEAHTVIWGVGYRYTRDRIRSSFEFSFEPSKRSDDLLSAFIQDDFVLVKDRLRLTLGAKFEHNDYTGFEVQPNARISWTPDERHALWASVSRAVRTPSRADRHVQVLRQVDPPGSLFPGSPPTAVFLLGSDDMDSEKLMAFELGYRAMISERLSFDAAAFYNKYDSLRSGEMGMPALRFTPAVHFVLPVSADNTAFGETYGVEVAADWKMLDWWRLQAAYSYLQMQLHLDRGSTDVFTAGIEGESPHHQFSLRSSMDITRNLEFNTHLRYADRLHRDEPAREHVKSYVELDAVLSWKPRKDLTVTVAGMNLLDNQHPEFIPEFVGLVPSEVKRSVYGKLTWRF